MAIAPRQGQTATIEILGRASATRMSAVYGCTLTVSFLPTSGGATCTVTPGARSCPNGGILAGRATSNGRGFDLQLTLDRALPNALGFTLASSRANTFTIGTSGCIFFNAPVVLGTFQTDATGSATTMYSIPAAMQGTTYIHEAALLPSPRGFQLGTSNTLQVTCQ